MRTRRDSNLNDSTTTPMHNDYLVRMANDIGNFFASDPDKEEAAHNVFAHLRRFWDPRMRAQIISYYRGGGEGLSDIVAKAVQALAQEESKKVIRDS
jgi:formate dehydrogenase subunit delta